MTLPLAAQRRARRRLYTLLLALHSGPLGTELLPQLRQLAASLGFDELPDTPAAFPADLHRWSYGYCPGNPELGCRAASPSGCLLARFDALAKSAGKGGQLRRRSELTAIERGLLPCLQTLCETVDSPYRELFRFSAVLVAQDAKQLQAASA